MEERLIDKDESRRIKIKHTAEGDDVVDALAPDGETAEESEEDADYIVELPEEDGEEYDEDLVGLTPSQLRARMEAKKRAEERARAEYQKLADDAKALLGQGEYERAEPLFAQAALYECDDGSAKRGLWMCRTKNFTETHAFYDRDAAQEFYWTDENVRNEVLEKLGNRIRSERAALEEEVKPLRAAYEAEKEKRAEAFAAHKRYYLIRSLIVFAAFVALAIGAIVSATFILKRSDNLALILTVAFAALALVVFVLFLVYALKTVNASRMCRANEQLASTASGAELGAKEDRIEALTIALGESEEEN